MQQLQFRFQVHLEAGKRRLNDLVESFVQNLMVEAQSFTL
jgi:hypothetical protein